MKTPDALNAFTEDCKKLASSGDHSTVAKLLEELISDGTFAASVPEFGDVEPSPRGWTLGGEHICYQSDELTVMVLDTLPGVIQPPHDHAMHVIIGVFQGCEDQRFFARGSKGVALTAERSLEAGDVVVLGERAIHAISSPADRPARAIHVYFGDIYAIERSLFHPDTLAPVSFNSDRYDEFCLPA